MDINIAESLHNCFLYSIPESNLISSVHKAGQIIIDEETRINVPTVLFDTGALHGNYISSIFINNHSKFLSPFLHPCNGVVKLADNKTNITINQLAVLPVTFIGNDGIEHSATVTFCVFPPPVMT